MLILAGVLYISLILGLSWWWGILQAIGVAYFMGAASMKLPHRARYLAIACVLALHTLMSLGTTWWLHFGEGPEPFWTISQIHGSWAKPLTIHCRPWVSISYGAMTMIGVLLGDAVATGDRKRIMRRSFWVGLVCILAGLAVHTAGLAWGVTGLCFNKPDVTASYALVASGVGALTFLLLYWVLDVRRIIRWSFPLREFGINALLAYFMQIIMRLGFRALGIEPLFSGSPNDMLRSWASLLDHPAWSALLLDKTGVTGLGWALLWTACLWLVVLACNRRGIIWKL